MPGANQKWIKFAAIWYIHDMKIFTFAALLFAALLTGACTVQPVESSSPEENPGEPSLSRQPVLVELFTSEGCENCPAAERTLQFLEEKQFVSGADVIGLAFHVDYWDRFGWKDRFSSADHTRRQQAYVGRFKLESEYTPQMVVDGQHQFIGSEMVSAIDAITRSAEGEKGTVEAEISAGLLKVSITGLGKHPKANVYLAIAEDGLSTEVRGGENQGRTLVHSSVVRNLSSIGQIARDSAEFTAVMRPRIEQGWNAGETKFIIFVQEEAGRKILAVGRAAIAG